MNLENLDQVLADTQQYWDIHQKWSLFHQTISLVISQRIRFSLGRQIRQNLYRFLGLEYGYSITPAQIRALSSNDYKTICMPKNKIAIITNIIRNIGDEEWNMDFDNLLIKLEKINGIGPWTISALKIMFHSNKYPNIFLTSDKWIESRFSELNLDLKTVVKNAPNLSNVSKFLWRIKPSGVQKLNNLQQLTADDFL
jgi:3-methyladenine DNA glycosylase/8-oxoguanine DNA glycosylase